MSQKSKQSSADSESKKDDQGFTVTILTPPSSAVTTQREFKFVFLFQDNRDTDVDLRCH